MKKTFMEVLSDHGEIIADSTERFLKRSRITKDDLYEEFYAKNAKELLTGAREIKEHSAQVLDHITV